jgi:hypothetical protein
MKLFSAFGAADLLEKDRQTVRRALRHVAPDGFEGKNPRWRLPTIIAALDAHFGRNKSGPTVNARLADLFRKLDEADAAMRGVASLERRRRLARERLIPLMREVDAAMRADAKARREPEMMTELRCEKHLQLFLIGFGKEATRGCDWPLEQAYREFNAVGDIAPDAA